MSNGKAVRQKFNKKMTLWIAQQDNCWLCGEKMPKPVMGNGALSHPPDYPTLDHVVPASQGGDRTYANLMLAHLRCNQARGNRREVVAVRFEEGSVQQRSGD